MPQKFFGSLSSVFEYGHVGAATFSIITFSIKILIGMGLFWTLSITTLSIMGSFATLSMMTFSIISNET
jgi:hypothetical protein